MSNVTIKGPAPRAMLRALKQCIYDCQEMPLAANAINNLTFFQNPIGGALPVTGTVKTLAETNLNSSSSLGVPQEFDMFGISSQFHWAGGIYDAAGAVDPNDCLDDLTVMYSTSVFKFFFGQQTAWLTIPYSKIPSGQYFATGPFTAGLNTDNGFHISNGESKNSEFYKMLANDKQISIGSAETFSARIEWPIAPVGLSADGEDSRVYMKLIGVLYAAL